MAMTRGKRVKKDESEKKVILSITGNSKRASKTDAEKRAQQKYYRNNKGRFIKAAKKWNANNVEKRREYECRRFIRDNGITGVPDDVFERRRTGTCEICGNGNNGKSLCLDHCHATGEYRGLLCDNCNSALGKCGDNLVLVMRFVDYLRRSDEKRK